MKKNYDLLGNLHSKYGPKETTKEAKKAESREEKQNSREAKLQILGYPSNQFGQEPKNDAEIYKWLAEKG